MAAADAAPQGHCVRAPDGQADGAHPPTRGVRVERGETGEGRVDAVPCGVVGKQKRFQSVKTIDVRMQSKYHGLRTLRHRCILHICLKNNMHLNGLVGCKKDRG